MNDAELSLEVARIMNPEYEWKVYRVLVRGLWRGQWRCSNTRNTHFDYTTDDAGMKMAVWLSNKRESLQHDMSIEEIVDDLMTPSIYSIMLSDNPHRALAEAIVEIGGER